MGLMEGRGLDQQPAAQIVVRSSDLEGAARLLTSVSDPRVAACLASSWMLRADMAALWEPRERVVVMTASTEGSPATRPPAVVMQAIETGERAYAQRRFGCSSVLVEPVRRGRRTIGALLIGWRRDIDDVDATGGGFLTLLAAQAALAIERADLAQELSRQAQSDPLTGVANRRGLARSLERDLAAARRSGRPLAVAMVDLDHFKVYNDREGHPAGDLLLRAATRAWADHLRAGDLLARYGGEEFAVVLPDCGDEMEVVGVVERLRRATPEGTTASAGVALWDGREPAAQLIRRADAALYEAKRAGRDATRLAGPLKDASPPRNSQTGSC
jgi:diguanylate cyclase (GGDEF)-like protein